MFLSPFPKFANSPTTITVLQPIIYLPPLLYFKNHVVTRGREGVPGTRINLITRDCMDWTSYERLPNSMGHDIVVERMRKRGELVCSKRRNEIR